MNLIKLEKEVFRLAAKCEGRVSLLIETDDGKIELNCMETYSSASLIKIPILIEAFRQNEKGILDLQQHIPVPPAVRVEGAGVLQALSDDLTMRIIDLMTLMVIVSDNTATNLLIDRLGMNEINQCIKDALCLESTELNRKMMDFESLKRGVDNTTTPQDMVTCLKAIHQNKLLSKENSTQAIKIMEKQQFTNKLSALMDSEKIQIANKTGELPGVEHDCAVIRCQGKTIYAAVLIDVLRSQESGRQTLSEIGRLIAKYI